MTHQRAHPLGLRLGISVFWKHSSIQYSFSLSLAKQCIALAQWLSLWFVSQKIFLANLHVVDLRKERLYVVLQYVSVPVHLYQGRKRFYRKLRRKGRRLRPPRIRIAEFSGFRRSRKTFVARFQAQTLDHFISLLKPSRWWNRSTNERVLQRIKRDRRHRRYKLWYRDYDKYEQRRKTRRISTTSRARNRLVLWRFMTKIGKRKANKVRQQQLKPLLDKYHYHMSPLNMVKMNTLAEHEMWHTKRLVNKVQRSLVFGFLNPASSLIKTARLGGRNVARKFRSRLVPNNYIGGAKKRRKRKKPKLRLRVRRFLRRHRFSRLHSFLGLLKKRGFVKRNVRRKRFPRSSFFPRLTRIHYLARARSRWQKRRRLRFWYTLLGRSFHRVLLPQNYYVNQLRFLWTLKVTLDRYFHCICLLHCNNLFPVYFQTIMIPQLRLCQRNPRQRFIAAIRHRRIAALRYYRDLYYSNIVHRKSEYHPPAIGYTRFNYFHTLLFLSLHPVWRKMPNIYVLVYLVIISSITKNVHLLTQWLYTTIFNCRTRRLRSMRMRFFGVVSKLLRDFGLVGRFLTGFRIEVRGKTGRSQKTAVRFFGEMTGIRQHALFFRSSYQSFDVPTYAGVLGVRFWIF
jgi:hypothetical protein